MANPSVAILHVRKYSPSMVSRAFGIRPEAVGVLVSISSSFDVSLHDASLRNAILSLEIVVRNLGGDPSVAVKK